MTKHRISQNSAGTGNANKYLRVNSAGTEIVFRGAGDDASDAEFIRDTIGAALTAGANITITVNDAGDTITIALDTAAEAERIRDVIGAAIVAGANVTVTVNDAGDTITIASTGGGGGSLTIQDENSNVATSVTQLDFAGAGVAATTGTGEVVVTIPGYTDEQARDAIGTALVAGTGVTISVNDAGDTITISSTGGGGGSALHAKANTIVATAVNTLADLGGTPYEDSLCVMVNGLMMNIGSSEDYTLSGSQVTFNSGVLTAGDKVRFYYWTTTASAADTVWHVGSVGGGGTPAGWSAGNTNPTMPSASAVGEQGILMIVTYSRLGGVSQPTASGWILIGSNTSGTPDGGSVRLTAFKKIVASGEPGNAVTVGYPGDAGAFSVAAVTSYSNVASVGTHSFQYTNGTSTPNNPLTTTVDNTKILHVVMTYRSNGGATLNITEPSGVTHRFGGNTGDTHGSADLCDEVIGTPGTAPTRTFTNDGGIGAVMDIPLIPA